MLNSVLLYAYNVCHTYMRFFCSVSSMCVSSIRLLHVSDGSEIVPKSQNEKAKHEAGKKKKKNVL